MREPTSPLRVLVVEDEALLAMDLEDAIEEGGHVVVGAAACTRSAAALPDDTDPDVALIDIQLARQTSGLDVAAMVRRRWPNTLIVFVTANPKRIPVEAYEADRYGVISKPFSRNGMLKALQYLEESLCAPPPLSRQPGSFAASGALTRAWAH